MTIFKSWKRASSSPNLICISIWYKNICENLYNEIENLLYANQEFGNNILKYLIDGFYLSSYFIFHYLTLQLISTDNTKINSNQLNKIFDLIDIDINDINKYYLLNNIDAINIPIDTVDLVNIELLNDFENEYDNLKNKLTEINNILENSDQPQLISNLKIIT